ncbi:MAG: tetratricopeptide repeat protein [Spartobacteria bacterium]|nr:tetratricopeptide repeat protein [Spartobacteria bacterium]
MNTYKPAQKESVKMDGPMYTSTSCTAAPTFRRLCGLACIALTLGIAHAQHTIPLAVEMTTDAETPATDLRVIALERMLAQARMEQETQQAQLQQRDAEINALRGAINDRDEMLDEYDESTAGQEALQARLDDLAHQNDVLRGEIVSLHATIETHQAMLATREAELSALKQSLNDRDVLLAESDTHIDELVTKADEFSEIERSNEVLEKRLQRQEEESADLRGELEACRQKQQDTLSQMAELETAKNKLQTIIAQQERKLSEMKDALANHDMLLKVVGQSEVTLADKKNELARLTARVAETEQAMETAKAEFDSQRDRYENQQTNLTATIEMYREQLATLQEEQRNKEALVDEMTRLNTEDQEAMARMQTEIQELQNQKDTLLANLVQREKELTTFKTDVQEKEELLDAQLEEYSALRQEIEALQQELIERDESRARLENEFKALTATLTKRENEIRTLNQQKNAISRVSEENRALQTKIAALEDSIGNYKRQLAKANGEATRTQQELRQMERLRERDQAERTALEKRLARLQNVADSSSRSIVEDTAYVDTTGSSRRPPAANESPAPVATGIPLGEQIADANRALRLGDIDEAERLFRNVLLIDTRQPGALLGLASCFYARQDYGESLRLTQQLIEEDALDGHALALQGLIMYKQGDLTGAAATMERAVMLRPDDAKLHNYMGMIFYARKQYKRAAREFQQSIDLNPLSSDAHRNLSLVTITASPDDQEFARRHYEEALRLGGKSDAKLEALIYRN